MGPHRGIEEYVFNLTGFLAVLLIYIWLDEFWLNSYNVQDYPSESRKVTRLLKFHPTSAIIGLALVVLAVFYKKLLSPNPAGFPAESKVFCSTGIFSLASEMQLRLLGLGFLQDGDVGVGVFPAGEEIL